MLHQHVVEGRTNMAISTMLHDQKLETIIRINSRLMPSKHPMSRRHIVRKIMHSSLDQNLVVCGMASSFFGKTWLDKVNT